MKNIALLTLLLLSLVQCRKEPIAPDPKDAARIEGTWSNMLPAHPDWRYEFYDGLLTQSVYDFGQPLSVKTYPYAIRQDTIFVGGDSVNAPRQLIVYFYCDSLVQCRTQGSGIINPILYLKRIK